MKHPLWVPILHYRLHASTAAPARCFVPPFRSDQNYAHGARLKSDSQTLVGGLSTVEFDETAAPNWQLAAVPTTSTMARKIRIIRPASEPGYKAEDLTVELDAGKLVTEIAKAVAEHHREAIADGKKASGGPQKPLGPDEARKAAKGKRSKERGMGTKGALPGYIRSTKGRAPLQATATVAPVAFYDAWLDREKARGVEYLFEDGDVDELVDELVEAELKRQGFSD